MIWMTSCAFHALSSAITGVSIARATSASRSMPITGCSAYFRPYGFHRPDGADGQSRRRVALVAVDAESPLPGRPRCGPRARSRCRASGSPPTLILMVRIPSATTLAASASASSIAISPSEWVIGYLFARATAQQSMHRHAQRAAGQVVGGEFDGRLGIRIALDHAVHPRVQFDEVAGFESGHGRGEIALDDQRRRSPATRRNSGRIRRPSPSARAPRPSRRGPGRRSSSPAHSAR